MEALTQLLTNIGTFFTQSISWMGEVLAEVTTEPALLILVIAMPVAGYAIGLLNRLIRM